MDFNKELVLRYFLEMNIRFLLLLCLTGLIIGFIRRSTYSNFARKPFGDFIINFFNIVGIPVHELGHLIMGLLFGFKITDTCFYRTTKNAARNGGTLGYVHMTHKTGTLFSKLQNSIGQFFVGIGPLIFGPAVILAVLHFMPAKVVKIKDILASMIQNKSFSFAEIKNWFFNLNNTDLILFFVMIYILIGIGSNLELSGADIKTALHGLLFLELLLLLIALICVVLNVSLTGYVSQIQNYMLTISAVGIGSSLLALIISII